MMNAETRNRLVYVAILAALAGYFGSEWTHRPRYTLTAAPGGGAYRIDSETGKATVCAPHRFDLVCGDELDAMVQGNRAARELQPE